MFKELVAAVAAAITLACAPLYINIRKDLACTKIESAQVAGKWPDSGLNVSYKTEGADGNKTSFRINECKSNIDTKVDGCNANVRCKDPNGGNVAYDFSLNGLYFSNQFDFNLRRGR